MGRGKLENGYIIGINIWHQNLPVLKEHNKYILMQHKCK
jgi:uncharacterized protein YuzE